MDDREKIEKAMDEYLAGVKRLFLVNWGVPVDVGDFVIQDKVSPTPDEPIVVVEELRNHD